jgi:DNA-binding transcriptional LysR family regulator
MVTSKVGSNSMNLSDPLARGTPQSTHGGDAAMQGYSGLRRMDADWDDLRVLLALSRAGSLAGAAKALKVDPTTVGRRLAALEASMGARLARRTPEGVSLTPDGEIAIAVAQQMEEAAQGLKRRLETDTSGVVRLTCTEAFMQHLFRFLPELQRAHPGLRVEYISENASLDLARGEADLALRFYRPTGGGIVVKKAGTVGWSLYGSDAYVARKGTVQLGDLRRHELVCFDEALGNVPGALWLAEHARDATVVFRGNGPRSLCEAVAAGLGIAVVPCFVAADNPLLRRLTPAVLTVSEAWTAVHEDLRSAPRVRAVLDFVHEAFARDRALLAGEV